MYRERLKRYASLIGDREPIVLQRQLPGMGRAMRYIITIADDDRRPLDKLCQNHRRRHCPRRDAQRFWATLNARRVSSGTASRAELLCGLEKR
jgi:hypothetical protein